MHVIERHLARHVAPERSVFHELTSTYVHVDVHIVPPANDRPFWLLYTTGMSGKPMTVPFGYDLNPYAELAMLLPPTWPHGIASWKSESRWSWPLTWLVDLARLPHRYDTWLGYGHTVPNGDPAVPIDATTRLSGVILGPSISIPDDAQVIRDGDTTIDLLTVWPIHDVEMDYKLRRCADELFAKLMRAGVSDVVDPARPSAI